jgi:hypothetical protein
MYAEDAVNRIANRTSLSEDANEQFKTNHIGSKA